MKIYLTALIVSVSILLSFFAYAQDERIKVFERERGQKAEKARYELHKKISKNSDSTIEFYGVVRDQYGKPVPDAKVEASYEHFDLLSPFFNKSSKVSTFTNAKGFFEFKCLKGRLLSIDKMEKAGYAYDFRKNEHRFFGYSANGLNPFIPDKQNPVIFIFHKKPEPAYVIKNSISYRERPKGGKFQIDVCDGFLRSSRTRTGVWGDMRVEIQPAAKAGDHTIKITLNNQNDCLQAKEPVDRYAAPDIDSWLLPEDPAEDHAAPEDGYGKSVEFVIKQHERIIRDIFYKGHKERGTVYSRLRLKLEAGNACVYVDGTLYTNLDGGKNLNYDRKYTLNRKIQDVTAKIDKEPRNVKLYQDRAELKRKLRLYDEAISDLDKALKIAPENKRLQYLKERTLTNKKRHAELKAQGFKFPD